VGVHRAIKDPAQQRDERRLFERSAVPGLSEDRESRERILFAAAGLFANKGYAGTAVREIVDAAGVTKPTLYYHFKNKEELYKQLMELAMGTFARTLDQALAREGSMRARLVGLFADIYQLFQEHVDLLRLVNSMIYGPQGATPAYDFQACSDHLERVFGAMLEAGVAAGELRQENQGEVMHLLMGVLLRLQDLLVSELMGLVYSPLQVDRVIDCILDGARGLYAATEASA
jgi:TetR/AcrR family transcriptional regulator